MAEMIKYNVLCVDPMDLHMDLCLGNVIQYCLEFDNPKSMYDKANYFLDVIFRQPYSHGHNWILMGLFDKIIGLGVPLKSYAKFFISWDNTDISSASFAMQYKRPPWAYQALPIYGNQKQQLYFWHSVH